MERSNLPAQSSQYPGHVMQAVPVIPQHFSHPGITLTQLFTIIWSYRKLSLYTALGFMVLAGVVSKLMTKTYEATATLMVEYEINDPLSGREFPVGLMASYMSTQTQLLRSPAILLPVVERLKLTDNEKYTAGYSGDGSTLAEWVKDKLAKKLVVEQGNWGSQLIYITYSASNAAEAALVANTVADVYAEQQFSRLTGPAADREKRYTEQLQELRNRVDVAQQKLTDFRQKSNILSGGGNVDIDMQRLSNLESRLVEAREQRHAAELRLNGNQAVGDAVLASRSIETLKADLATQKTRMAELRSSLGPMHPQVRELASQIASTQQAIDNELRVYQGNAQSQLDNAKRTEAQLERQVATERAKTLEEHRLQDESAKYELELESAQTLYRRALDGYDQIVLASNGGYNNVRSISRAQPPVKASKPQTIINVIVGLLFGAVVGIIGPLFYELFNRKIRCRDDLDRDFGIPVLVEFDSMPTTAMAGAK
jgi:uncharacterized protein involved in exopolysaccharide biosynthesis